VTNMEQLFQQSDNPAQPEVELLRHELAQLQANSRNLHRQLEKARLAAEEARRAHAKMVATLTETMRENTWLEHDRDMWRARAQRLEHEPLGSTHHDGPIDIGQLAGQISDEEINAIRKAMARLHHPDVGGSPDRMKAWNAALDRICKS
jgi:septal ring factor EnvC (AmiA/AmiB activator)